MIAAILFMTVMGVAGVFGYKVYQFEQMSSIERLNYLWKQDMNLLKPTQHVHKGWNSIAEFEAFGGSEKAKEWLNDLQVPVRKVEKGKFKLEILLLEFDQEDVEHAVIQMNLVEIKSQNMVWELGRTYKLNSYYDHLMQEIKDSKAKPAEEPEPSTAKPGEAEAPSKAKETLPKK
ncbi:MAG: hypothetical protein HRT45_03415 [Bdellovibrionales bacterium]|nr:hypothetical protein [Bdellovibrionales bacterium]